MQESIVVVTVPAGVSPGEEMVVCVDGVDMVVVVPPGAESGSLMDVMIPRKAEPATDGSEGGRRGSVDIELPCECRPGDELVVDVNGASVVFRAPEDAKPGSVVCIELPLQSSSRRSSCCLEDMQSRSRRSSLEELGNQPWRDGEAVSPSPHRPSCRPQLPFSKFWVGLEVEVLRTDGKRTFGIVEGVDYLGGTYDIKLPSGLMKYMIEEEDLRHYRSGKYYNGDAVKVQLSSGTREREARIAGYDDDAGTYSVILADGDVVEDLNFDQVRKMA